MALCPKWVPRRLRISCKFKEDTPIVKTLLSPNMQSAGQPKLFMASEYVPCHFHTTEKVAHHIGWDRTIDKLRGSDRIHTNSMLIPLILETIINLFKLKTKVKFMANICTHMALHLWVQNSEVIRNKAARKFWPSSTARRAPSHWWYGTKWW